MLKRSKSQQLSKFEKLYQDGTLSGKDLGVSRILSWRETTGRSVPSSISSKEILVWTNYCGSSTNEEHSHTVLPNANVRLLKRHPQIAQVQSAEGGLPPLQVLKLSEGPAHM